MCLSTLYLQFVCGGGQQLLQRQSDRLLTAKSQRAESNLEINHCVTTIIFFVLCSWC